MRNEEQIHTGTTSTGNRQPSEDTLSEAIRNHEAGRLQEAEDAYRMILERDPGNADVLNLMGILAHQRKRPDEAGDLIERAISKNGLVASYHGNLGIVMQSQGRFDDAVRCYQEALALNPDFTEARMNLAIALQSRGNLAGAIEEYRVVLRLRPGLVTAHFKMGLALYHQGEFDAAVASYRKAIHLRPGIAEGYNNLGLALGSQGNLDEAIRQYRRAIQIRPDYAEAHGNLGTALRDQRKLGEAEESYREAIRLKPDCAELEGNLGAILRDQGRLGEAVACYRRALHLNPYYPQGHNNLGGALRDQGRIEEAIASFQKEMESRPALPFVHSNLLLTLHYNDAIDPIQLFSHHREWARQHTVPRSKGTLVYPNDRSPNRRLRIGYVSPDFRMHSVAYFLEPVLSVHDSDTCEVVCYSNVIAPDPVTDRLRGLSDRWRSIVGLSDERVADLIQGDRIDILVDLAGHTANNRLSVFAQRPAPVQVTYLGYPNTTGLPAMDYRITDEWADPAGRTEHLHTEELVRLPEGFLCYRPPEEVPGVSTLPALNTGYVTFGSFNDRAKITPGVVKRWSAILESVPGSRLILKTRALNDEGTRQALREMFSENGVDPQRIELIGYLPFEEHLRLYNRIDIGLDTFPYHGTTTTCEALWMGVPVITLAGETHVSRVGVSLLSRMGLPELIAGSSEEYREKIVRLAGDPDRLRDLRAHLRPLMIESPLTDAARFTRSLEKAYRKMWKRWCG